MNVANLSIGNTEVINSSRKLTNIATPTLTTDGATKGYVDSTVFDGSNTSDMHLADSQKIYFGTDDDSFIEYNGTNFSVQTDNGDAVFDNRNTTGHYKFQLGSDTDATSHDFLNNSGDYIMTVRGDGQVGVGTSAPVDSALVECVSTDKGFLPPRMTTVQKDAISSPAAGLVVYDSTLNKLCVYNGSAWETVTSS